MIQLIVLRLLESAFRRWFLWLIPVVLMAAFAGVRFFTATPVYISLAAVYINKQSLLASLSSVREDGFSWVTPAQATVDEFAELLKTDAFMRSVVQLTDLEEKMHEGSRAVADTLIEAREAVWVQTLGKNLLMVGAAHERPGVAQQLAAATIEVYIRWKINTDLEESTAALRFLEELAERYRVDMEAAEEELRAFLESHPTPVRGDRPAGEEVEVERLQRALDIAVGRYTKALDDLESTQLAGAVAESKVRETYLLLDAARLPHSPQRSKKSALIESAVFVVVGLFFGVVGVVGAALLDRTIRFPEDVRIALELPVLGVIPAGGRSRDPESS